MTLSSSDKSTAAAAPSAASDRPVPAGPIKGIVFDKDGVLFDFQGTWGAWAHRMIGALAEGDDALAQTLADALAYDRPTRSFRPESFVIAGPAHHISEALAVHLPHRSLTDIHEYLVTEAANTPLAPAVPLRTTLSALKAKGFRLGVATNDAERAARAQLASQDALDLFDMVNGFDSGYGAKPDPGMCLAFAEATGLAPETLVMVGDSTHDIDAGRAAGFTCVAVLTGVATEADLAPHADIVLPDIAALEDWLESL
ncbi:HAD family hydrolase [Gymnodinialimonas ceratoperidinii]|uniref:HAD family hydrolase n=1 Tax=Gymnodinialimonas ceratoperidinii TaxID=2856823 RepID=A0A8F6TXY4_9RHOB|nr:HAD family hydrolase [Gymnodinialimonas ceratoperidinii]QXT40961.1 HAD family hydrolase [Gymnodinialimonas ceratoperidinii]